MLLRTRTAIIALALAMPGAAFAATTASNETADPFAGEVKQKCEDAASAAFRRSQVVVDPKGSESYGVAIVFGRSKELKGRAAMICVVDRKTGKAELGSLLSPDVVRVLAPKSGHADKGQENGGRKKHNMQDQNNKAGSSGQNNDDNSNDDSDGGQ